MATTTEDDAWSELRDVYAPPSNPKNREKPPLPGVALVLGAGVSAKILPEWEELLERIAERCSPGGRNIVQDLDEDGFSLPAIAAVLESKWRAKEEKLPKEQRVGFPDLVRQTLYSDLYKTLKVPDNPAKFDKAAFVDHVNRSNSTLRAVASFCTRRQHGDTGGGRRFGANPRVHAIVTFNIDHLLQVYSRARFGARITRTIERSSKTPRPGSTNIYHLHGCIRFDEKASNPRKNAPDAMVLTEHSYFDVYNQPTSFQNYTFLNILREYPCLFIGLSMHDENLRRLLHYSRQERERAYRLEGRNKPVKKTVRHFAIMRRTEPSVDGLTEDSLRRLGVRVLWIDGFGEVPVRLGEVYEAAGNPWKDVWEVPSVEE